MEIIKMKNILLITLAGLSLIVTGCGEKKKNGEVRTFMFWCFREEVVSSDYHIPDMTTPAIATYIQNQMKGVPGFESSRCDLSGRTLTISYQSSVTRKMNFEESIAIIGFSVNGRPANPKARIPAGVLK